MIPGRAELLRRRRCRMLVVGMVLAVLLPVFQWSWITLGVGLVGIALLLLAYRRECRDRLVTDSAPNDTHTRGPEA
jgi:hypothetical protein